MKTEKEKKNKIIKKIILPIFWVCLFLSGGRVCLFVFCSSSFFSCFGWVGGELRLCHFKLNTYDCVAGPKPG